MADQSKEERSNKGLFKQLKPSRKAVVFVICLLLATGSWFANTLTGSFETTYSIPLSYQNQPFSTRLDGDLPKQVVFHYQGSGWELLGLSMKRFPDSIKVDLGESTNKQNGKIFVRSVSLVNQLPQDPLPYKIEPEVIAPGLITETSKKIPIRLVYDIQYRKRFGSVTKPQTIPDSILISGPPQLLRKIDSVFTHKFSRTDVFADLNSEVEIASKLPKEILISHQTIEVRLDVSEFTEQSVIIPVEMVGELSEPIKLIPSKVKVTFQYPMDLPGPLDPSLFKAVVDANQLKNDVPLEVMVTDFPPGVQGIRLDPPRLEYLLETKRQ